MKEFTKAQRMLDIISWALLIIYAILCVVAIFAFDHIIIHFDFAGQPDGWGGSFALLFEFAMVLLIYFTINFVLNNTKYWNIVFTLTKQNKEYIYRQIRWRLILMKLFFISIFIYIFIFSVLQFNLGAWFTIIIILICALIIILPTINIFRYNKKFKQGEDF